MSEKGKIISLEKGEYEITGRIGEGAYGVVWEARRVADGEIFALKTVQTHHPDEKIKYPTDTVRQIAKSLGKEIAFLRCLAPEEARKNHIVPMTDSGEHEESPVMVMMRCENSLNRVYVQRQDMKDGGFPFDASTLLEWLRQLAAGLKKIHSQEIGTDLSEETESSLIEIYSPDPEEGSFVIRDLKFKNVLVREGKLYLADFGTVKPLHRQLTVSRVTTPEWAAPETLLPKEIVSGKPRYALTPRVDIYSLGLMFHALITGVETKAQKAFFVYPFLNREFGSVGGLTAEEKQTLEQHLRRLFIPGGRTVIPMRFVSLPDTESLIREFSALIESMLAPLAENRPSSARVLEKSGELSDFLSPEIKELHLKIPPGISFGKAQRVYVQVRGKGLPRHGKWLNLEISGRPVSADFRPVPEHKDVWESVLPPFDKEGKYEIEVFAVVHHEKIPCVQTVEIAAAAEQLWAMGRYAEALKKEPDKSQWLDDLEKKFGDSEEYLEILEKVLEEHPKHIDINRRYWPLKHDMERRVGKSEALPTEQRETADPLSESGFPGWKGFTGFFSLFLRKPELKRILVIVCLLLLCVGGWSYIRRVGKSGALPTDPPEPSHAVGTEKHVPTLPPLFEPSEPQQPPVDPMLQKRRAAEKIWEAIQGYLQSGNTEMAEEKLSEKKSDLEILPEVAEKIPLLEEFFVFYDKAESAGKSQTSEEQESIIGDYEKALEICGKLSITGLRDAVSAELKKAETVRDNLLVAEKKERERLAELQRIEDEKKRIAELKRIEEEQKRRDAEDKYTEIVNTVNAGKWPDVPKLISDKRELLKNWLDKEKYGHMTELETFFGHVADAENLRAKNRFQTPEEYDAVLDEYEKARQIALKLPDKIQLAVRIQGKKNELTQKRDELIAKIQKEKEEQERQQKQSDAEDIYAAVIQSVKNGGDRKTAEKDISGLRKRNLLTYLDKSKAGHIRSLEEFWKYADEGDRLARTETPENLKSAADAYARAEGIAKNLSGVVTLGSDIAGKRQKVLARWEELQHKDQRFVANRDGTVYDRKMNLTWAAEDNGSNVNWKEAYEYCTKTYKGGGWRMPTQDELYSLVGERNGVVKGYDCDKDWSNYIITKLIHLTCAWVWASEKDGSSAADVRFYSGNRLRRHMDGSGLLRALPVRSGKW